MAERKIAKKSEDRASKKRRNCLWRLMFGWLKTPLDWIAAGCLVSDIVLFVVVWCFLLPIAIESNDTLLEIKVEVTRNTNAVVVNQKAIESLLKEHHAK